MASTDLVLRTAQETGFTATAVELIRNTAAKNCSDDEVAQLLIIAHKTGLDPLARQVYMIRRWDRQAGREIATPQTGIDGYRLIADRTNRYAPGRAPTLEYDASGNLVSATAYIKKLAGNQWHEVAATAYWDEYAQRSKQGGLTPLWEKMPRLMLAKCAEALALRRAFPAELSGLYTAEEMAQADNPTVTVEVAPGQLEPTKPVPNGDVISALQLRRLHMLGKEVYGSEWDTERKRLVAFVTNNQKSSSKDLNAKQAATLIEGLEKKADENRAALEVESYEVPDAATEDITDLAGEPRFDICESCGVAPATTGDDTRALCEDCLQRAIIAAELKTKRGKSKSAA